MMGQAGRPTSHRPTTHPPLGVPLHLRPVVKRQGDTTYRHLGDRRKNPTFFSAALLTVLGLDYILITAQRQKKANNVYASSYHGASMQHTAVQAIDMLERVLQALALEFDIRKRRDLVC